MVSQSSRIILALALAFTIGSEGLAEAKKSRRSRARKAFKQAQRHFQAERYEKALPFFEKAYKLSRKRPSSIFGLAQCERALKMYDPAIVHFKEYLAAKPKAKNASEVKDTIALLEELKAEGQKPVGNSAGELPDDPDGETGTEPPPPSPPPEPPPPKPEPNLTQPPDIKPQKKGDDGGSFWTTFLIITGIAVAAGGAVTAGVLLSGEQDPYGGNTGVLLSRLRLP